MLKGYTHIHIVLDRTGSMGAIAHKVIEGFNDFMARQREQKEKCTVSLVQFDSEDPYEVIAHMRAPKHIDNLTHETYQPRSMTPLYDALGKSIHKLGKTLFEMKESERPEGVVVLVITDGEENSSKEYKRDKVLEMIKHQQEHYKWNFVFMASNLTALDQAQSVGILRGQTLAFDQDDEGVSNAFAAAADNVVSYRTSNLAETLNFSGDQKTKQRMERLRK